MVEYADADPDAGPAPDPDATGKPAVGNPIVGRPIPWTIGAKFLAYLLITANL